MQCFCCVNPFLSLEKFKESAKCLTNSLFSAAATEKYPGTAAVEEMWKPDWTGRCFLVL